MRDILTVIAGVLVLVLVAALAAPAFIDWNQHRATIEAQLSRAAGVEVVTTGPIKLSFLPSPRISIGGLRAGDASAAGTRLTATMVRADLELAGALRGEWRISDMALDGVELALALRNGGAVRPTSWTGPVGTGSIARLTVTRGLIRISDGEGAAVAAADFAIQAQQIAPLGPWRIEGEVARRSIRIVTGDRDGAGRLRVKVNLTDGPMRGEFDGWVGLPGAGDIVRPVLLGGLQAAWHATGDQPPLLTAAGQIDWTQDSRRIAGLVLDSVGVGRLDGEAVFAGGLGGVTLRGRRVDLGVWLQRLESDGFGADLRKRIDTLAPHVASLTVGLEQMTFRGEELSDVEGQAERAGDAWRIVAARARFAGTVLGLRGTGDALAFSADSPDLRRVALALQRLGLPAETASDLGLLGDLRLEGRAQPQADGWRVDTWSAEGRFGKAAGTAAIRASGSEVGARIQGADLLALTRPAAALASLAPGALHLRLDAAEARLGTSPPGRGAVTLSRRDGAWSLLSADISGFDGVLLQAHREGPQAGLRLIVTADRADALAALGERFTDARDATHMLRALRGVSPLRADVSVQAAGTGWTARMVGSAGPMALAGEMALTQDGRLADGRMVLTAADRGLLFRAFGLPAPAARAVQTEVTATVQNGRSTLSLSGADGVRAQLTPQADGGTFALTFAGPADGLLPRVLGASSGGALAGAAVVVLRDAAILLDGIAGDMGGARFAGALTVHGADRVEGHLLLPNIDAAVLASEAFGERTSGADGGWSGERFARADAALDLDVAVRSDRVLLPGVGAMAGSARLHRDTAGLRLKDIALLRDDATISGDVEIDISGPERAARMTLAIKGADLSSLGPEFAGRADITLQAGAFGDSPARLAASLNGSGEVSLRGVGVLRFDPAALERIAAGVTSDIIVTNASQLAQTVRRAVETSGWPLADRTLGFLVAGGVARLGVFIDDKPRATGAFNGFWDARSGVGELRAAAALKASPTGWRGAPPQIALTWRGPWRQMQRAYDVSALSNALSLKALQREIERVETFEAEIRERAETNRRLRAEQEEARRQAEADAARLRDQPAPEPGTVPPLPPAIIINPVPAPLSRPQPRAN